MDSGEVAKDGDGRDVFAVKGEDGVAERAHLRARLVSLVCLLLVGSVALHRIVLQVVCASDFGQQRGHHFDDVADGHSADFVLCLAGCPGRSAAEDALLDEALDMGEVTDVNDILRRRVASGIAPAAAASL